MLALDAQYAADKVRIAEKADPLNTNSKSSWVRSTTPKRSSRKA